MSTRPRTLVIQNAVMSPPASVATTAARNGVDVHTVRACETDVTELSLQQYASVVVLGGSMDSFDEAGYPFLREVMDVMRRSIDAELPVLGICLGAQLAARLLDARAYRGTFGRELGWTPLQKLPAASDDPIFSQIEDNTLFMEWHQDTFEMPKDAIALARTETYEHQAFRYGSLLAVQFHPDVDDETLRIWQARLAAIEPEITPSMDVLLKDSKMGFDASERFLDLFWKDVLQR